MFAFITLFALTAISLFASASASPTGDRALIARQTYTGQGTFFDVALGACGITNAATDLVVAASDDMYETWPGATPNPNLNPICGKTLTAFYGSKSVTATVVDRCGGCTFYDLDFSRGAFDQLASEDLGRIDITWEWN